MGRFYHREGPMFYLRFNPAAVTNTANLEAELAHLLAGLFGVHNCLFGDGQKDPENRKPYAYEGDKITIGRTNDHWLHPEGDGVYKVVARYKTPELMDLYRQVLDHELRNLRPKAFLGATTADPRVAA